MCLLFETIKVKNRQLLHLPYHDARLNRSRSELFGNVDAINLENIIQIPRGLNDDTYKCRVIYSRQIVQVEFLKYTPRQVKSLKVVHCNNIDYHLKYQNREQLISLFNERGPCDDVIIVKNGLVTDTSYSNLVFWDGRQWITPANPLLEGTTRARLLDEGEIVAREIKASHLQNFSKIRIINALNSIPESEDATLVL